MNVPIPFYYFIGSTDETKKYIDLKYTRPRKQRQQGFMNINAEPAKRVEYYYITDIINDATALIGSLIKTRKTPSNK
jgi:hypothetical protein